MAEKVLIVDDDPETVRLIMLVLKRQGYEILSAYEGKSAIQLAQNEQPALILLDIMLPGIDGYQVTRLLRKNPDTANLTILMFSAKNQVEDRVRGYDSGIDDFLVKPIHPAELTARVKSLLSRSKTNGASFGEKGYTIGVLGASGGCGASSFALNLAISSFLQTSLNIIAAELKPGQGSWALDLDLKNIEGLGRLLRLNPGAITTSLVKNQLFMTPYGIKLLCAPFQVEDVKLLTSTESLKKVVKILPLLASIIVLDLGTGNLLNTKEITALCDEIVLLVQPLPACLKRARMIRDEILDAGFGRDKNLSLVVMKHFSSRMQASMDGLQQLLETEVLGMIEPALEIAYQSGIQNKPMLSIQPESNFNKKYTELTQKILQHINADH